MLISKAEADAEGIKPCCLANTPKFEPMRVEPPTDLESDPIDGSAIARQVCRSVSECVATKSRRVGADEAADVVPDSPEENVALEAECKAQGGGAVSKTIGAADCDSGDSKDMPEENDVLEADCKALGGGAVSKSVGAADCDESGSDHMTLALGDNSEGDEGLEVCDPAWANRVPTVTLVEMHECLRAKAPPPKKLAASRKVTLSTAIHSGQVSKIGLDRLSGEERARRGATQDMMIKTAMHGGSGKARPRRRLHKHLTHEKS